MSQIGDLTEETRTPLKVAYVLAVALAGVVFWSASAFVRLETTIADMSQAKKDIAEIQREQATKREQVLSAIYALDLKLTEVQASVREMKAAEGRKR